MKKGITLIELLAVIIILAIIGSISFITIGNIVKNSKINLYNENITKIKDTAEMYISNGNKGYIEEGQTVEITLDELISDGYIKEVKSPFDKSKTCTGYVLIEKTTDDEYLYNPHINCEEDINNSTEDELVLHYTFDDFQEPTTNLVVRPEFLSTSMGYPWGSWSPAVLTFGTANVLGYDTNYTNITKEADGSVNAIHQAIGSLTIGSSYTLSFYARINPNSASTTGKIRAYINDGYIDYPITKEWSRISLTRAATAVSHTIHITQYNVAYDVQIAHVQFEKKSYSTPFVNGVRTGVVKDYSVNNVEASLTEIKTPKWVKISDDNAIYQFDGASKSIVSDDLAYMNGSQTFNAWIKIINYSWLSGIISNHDYTTTSNLGLNIVDNKVSVSIGYTNGSREYNVKRSVGIISLGTWTMVTMIYDSTLNKISFYINGEFDSIHNVTTTIKYTNYNIVIGQWSLPANNYYFNGFIDDVRIYSRTLSANEIEMIYKISKDNYN